MWTVLVLGLSLSLGPGCGHAQQPQTEAEKASADKSQADAARQQFPDETEAFMDAAETAWAFVDRNYQPRTGLVKAHETYDFVTVWDIGSMALAYHSAHELGLIDRADLDRRLGTLLGSLQKMSLFEGTAHNKLYNAVTGEAVDRKERASEAGYGWSVLDLGRLLVALHVVATQYPEFRDEAEAVVARLKMDQLVKDGYLIGRDLDPAGGPARSYQEGRIGYEQYAAEGFAAWGVQAPRALSFSENTQRVEVLGVPLLVDRRGNDKLTSEAFVMMGLELGWTRPEWREMAEAVLAAQKARYDKTGQITMVSEDALPVAPYYFYYYSVYHNGKEFVVDAPGSDDPLDDPRWISTKAAFGWHALLPSSYTSEAVQAVAPAATPKRGWSAGVYEGTGRSTGSRNMNTAAIVLESAAFRKRGKPLAEP